MRLPTFYELFLIPNWGNIYYYSSRLIDPPRVCSTKTRIKTQRLGLVGLGCPLREYVPLKQGLRLDMNVLRLQCEAPRVCSAKTRIKTNASYCVLDIERLREYVPLKQGLRRRKKNWTMPVRLSTPRVCSTKTRIKTQNGKEIAWETWASESMFH